MKGVINVDAWKEKNERMLQQYLNEKKAVFQENEIEVIEKRKEVDTMMKELEEMINNFEKRIGNNDVGNNRLKNSSQQDDIVSGLVYVRESHRIGFRLPRVTNNIGLVVGALKNGEPKWTMKKEVDTAPAGQRLEEEWKLLFSTDSSLSDDDFFQNIVRKCRSLTTTF